MDESNYQQKSVISPQKKDKTDDSSSKKSVSDLVSASNPFLPIHNIQNKNPFVSDNIQNDNPFVRIQAKSNGSLTSKQSITQVNQPLIQLVRNKLVSWGTSEYAKEARAWREEEDLGGRNVATVNYTVLSEKKTYSTSEVSDGRHSEARLFDYMKETYGEDYKTKIEFHWLYTERDTCGKDYHDCAEKVKDWFPNAKIYCSVAYVEEDDVSSSSDEEKNEKAKRRRSRSTNMVKRFQTRASQVKKGKSDYEDEYNPPLQPPFSPAHYSQEEQFKK